MGPSLLLWTRTIDHYAWCKRKRKNDDGRENGEYSLILLLFLVFFPKLAASFLGQMIARTLVSFARPNIFHAKQWHYCPNNWGVSYSLFGYRVCIAIVGTKLITVLALLFKEMSLCTCKKILYDQKFFFRMIVMFFVLLDALST